LAAGFPSLIGRTKAYGRRVGFAPQLERFQLYVEVEGELTSCTEADLIASYADQAVKYVSTSVALAFHDLLVLSEDLVRVDLDHAFRTTSYQMPASRVYSVTGLRVRSPGRRR
jgi:hypothetical protein